MAADRHIFRRRYTAAGAPPGSLSSHGGETTRVHRFSFDANELEEGELESVDAIEFREGRTVWVDVQGLADTTLIEALGAKIGMHALALADSVNVGQQPKCEVHGDGLLIALRMVTLGEMNEIRWEQVCLYLDARGVLSFQERDGDCLDSVRERLRAGRKLIRSSGPGYLAVMLVDAIVDGYFPVLDAYAEEIETLEASAFDDENDAVLEACYRVRRELSIFRRALIPLREALGGLHRDPDAPIPDEVYPYVRDVVDHLNQISDVVDGYRELAEDVSNVYLSLVGYRTNETMRTLTVVAAIFIPLTFLAGIYGMNFDTSQPGNLPELGWKYGYPAFWGVSLVIVVTLLVLFRRMGWLGKR